jgi:hypothetical protein
MSIILIPTMEETVPLSVPESPFHRLTTLPRSELVSTRDVPADERRLLTKRPSPPASTPGNRSRCPPLALPYMSLSLRLATSGRHSVRRRPERYG